jgi:alkaline phosphatase
MKRYIFKIGLLLGITWIQMGCSISGITKINSLKYYENSSFYHPVQIDENNLNQEEEVKNIILFIGDGMGVSQVFSGMTANKGNLNLEYLKYIGFSKTQAYDDFITDSGAGATAIASGVKSYNGAIGVNHDTVKVPTLIELAEAKGLSTGLIATSSITHATPACFISHQKSRSLHEAIALDFLQTDIDVVIGGGRRYFANRSDGVSLFPLLQKSGYKIITNRSQLTMNNEHKFYALLNEGSLPKAKERKNFLTHATQVALNLLEKNEKGFFLMIEGSQIDWGGHENDTNYIVEEMLDMDRAIGAALEFAAQKGQTLIICTADHETGGMALESGNTDAGQIEADYTSSGHTAVMVPVFSIGPGAEEFIGIYENTDLFYKMKSALNLQCSFFSTETDNTSDN